ncbi:MAG: hypothetical protein VX265_09785 [Myxococcota bacterium]|nr:hypothetical protein [Myxococcota bacterium]
MNPRFLLPWALFGSLAIGITAGGDAAAGKGDAVERQVAMGKLAQARERCDKLEVAAELAEAALLEACARAFLPVVEADDSAAAWAGFGERFAGSTLAERARSAEGAAVLRELSPRTAEEQLLLLAKRYVGTEAAATFSRRAADAAVRDARTADAAIRAARRYPGHPGLPVLVEAWPDAFLTVDFEDGEPRVRTDPPVVLTGEFEPRLAKVAREPGGAAEDWDVAARNVAKSWGVPGEGAAGIAPGRDISSVPMCWAPGQPSGWGPFLEVRVGAGSMFERLAWEDGCGPDAWPVFLTYAYGQAVGISLRPGHAVDLQAITGSTGRRHVRGFLATSDAPPRLENGRIYQETDLAWLVTPLAGGAPWVTRSGPGEKAVTLDNGIRGAGLPREWVVDTGPDSFRVVAPALDKLPPALRSWDLMPGEIRVPPPLVQALIGVQPKDARPDRPPAPVLGPAGWKRTPGGSVLREPPDGARIAGLYAMDPDDLATARGLIRGVGFADEWVLVLDGWKADVDADADPELFLRAEVDGVGTLFAIDLVDPSSGRPGAPARVFAIETPRVKADAGLADMPFAFRRGDFVFLAWGGAEVLGSTSRRHFVNVVRFDGTGFVVDDIDLE